MGGVGVKGVHLLGISASIPASDKSAFTIMVFLDIL